MLKVMRNHRAAAYDAMDAYDGIEIKPQGINARYCPDYLLKALPVHGWTQFSWVKKMVTGMLKLRLLHPPERSDW
jgi:hypothetical protein